MKKRKIRNQAWKTRIKTSIKKVEEAIAKNEKELIQNVLKEAIIIINKAASKGIIHKNTASRKISRLMKKVNSVLLVSVSNN